MKQIKLLVCLLLLFPLLSCALAEESGEETVLHAADVDLKLTIPAEFSVQRITGGPNEAGYTYSFENPETGTQFMAFGALDTPEDQAALLRQVRDAKNGMVITAAVSLGGHRFLAYYPQGSDWTWHFLLLTDTGYSFRFWYSLPIGQGQAELPPQAADILSSLRLTDKAIPAPVAVPALRAENFPAPQPIDESDKGKAEKQMEAYCRALTAALPLNKPVDEKAPAAIDWKPAQYNMEGWDYGAVYTVTLWSEPAFSGGWADPDDPMRGRDKIIIALRPDGTVRDFSYSAGDKYAGNGRQYAPQEAQNLFAPAWQEELALYLLQLTEGVWPGSADRIEAVCDGWTTVTDSGYCLVEIYGDYYNEDGTKLSPAYNPFLEVEVFPEFHVLEYGLGVG